MESSLAPEVPAPRWKTLAVDHAVLAIVLCIVHAPVIFFEKTFRVSGMFDWSFLAQPAYVYTGTALARGEFPLWNPNWFAGYPHLAVPSNGLLYPTTILFGVFPFVVAVKLVVLGHVYIFASLSYLLGREMFSARSPALYLGICAIIGSFATLGLQGGHLWTLMTIAWMPLAFVCLRRILYTGRVFWALVLAPILAVMFLAGDPQTMSFIYLWFGVYTATLLACGLVSRTEPIKRLLLKGLLCLAAVGAAVGLAAVQLLPSQELMGQSIRSGGVSYDYFRMAFIGVGGKYSNAAEACAYGLVQETVPESFFVPGKVTAALIFIAILGGVSAEVIAIWVAVAATLVFAGTSPWLYENIIRHIPTFSSMRGSFRIVGMTIFLSHLLAAYGVSALLRTEGALGRARWAAAGGLAAAMLASSLYFDSQFLAPSVLTVIALVLIAISIQRRPWPGTELAAALLVMLSIEMLPNFLSDVKTEADSVLEVTPDYRAFSEAKGGIDRVHIVDPLSAGVRHGYGVGLLTGDRLIEGSHALFLQRISDLYDVFTNMSVSTHDERGRIATQGPYEPVWITPDSFILFDLLNVRHIVRYGAPVPLLESAAQIAPASYSVSRIGELYVYENRRAMPPLFPIHEVVPVADSKLALEMIRSGEVDYRRQATVPEGTEIPELAPAAVAEPIVLKNYGPNSIEATVTLGAPALLVLSEMWYPDWFAQVDGGPPQRTLCVDSALQGTPVPAGKHEVRFFYRPSSVIRGLIVTAGTAVAWLACVIAAFMYGRRTRRRGSTATDHATADALPADV